MALKIDRMVLGYIGTNVYFICDEENGKVIVVDPADNGEEIYKAVTNSGLSIAAILLTHGHYDHILGVEKLRELSGAKVYASIEEKDVLEDPNNNLTGEIGKPFSLVADVYLKDSEDVNIDGIKFKCIITPGHTKGSCCYYFAEEKTLISGDTLFEGSVGRTDFPTGSMSNIVRSIKEKLIILPEETRVYPGHGGFTTIEEEKKYNPFIN